MHRNLPGNLQCVTSDGVICTINYGANLNYAVIAQPYWAHMYALMHARLPVCLEQRASWLGLQRLMPFLPFRCPLHPLAESMPLLPSWLIPTACPRTVAPGAIAAGALCLNATSPSSNPSHLTAPYSRLFRQPWYGSWRKRSLMRACDRPPMPWHSQVDCLYTVINRLGKEAAAEATASLAAGSISRISNLTDVTEAAAPVPQLTQTNNQTYAGQGEAWGECWEMLRCTLRHMPRHVLMPSAVAGPPRAGFWARSKRLKMVALGLLLQTGTYFAALQTCIEGQRCCPTGVAPKGAAGWWYCMHSGREQQERSLPCLDQYLVHTLFLNTLGCLHSNPCWIHLQPSL